MLVLRRCRGAHLLISKVVFNSLQIIKNNYKGTYYEAVTLALSVTNTNKYRYIVSHVICLEDLFFRVWVIVRRRTYQARATLQVYSLNKAQTLEKLLTTYQAPRCADISGEILKWKVFKFNKKLGTRDSPQGNLTNLDYFSQTVVQFKILTVLQIGIDHQKLTSCRRKINFTEEISEMTEVYFPLFILTNKK